MAIVLIKDEVEVEYDATRSLKSQIENCSKIEIYYQQNDIDYDRFLNEMIAFCQEGLDHHISIAVMHNNYITGKKLKNQVKRLNHDIKLNEVIKAMNLNHADADKKLEEILQFLKKAK